MRLLKKNNLIIGGYQPMMSSNGMESQSAILNKLGQLEDIEEELGIGLITLFTILKTKKIYIKGDYVNDEWELVKRIKEFSLEYDKIYIHYTHNYFELKTHWEVHRLDIKDYGKTWALTKEELL